MQSVKRIAAGLLACLSFAGFLASCSKLTDPSYEFMTLREIDGKPLPTAIRFGPDSGLMQVRSGRLGFSNASLGLPCRVELKLGFPGNEIEGGGGIGTHPRCDTGGDDPVVAEGVLNFNAGTQPFEIKIVFSGTHTLSFRGLIRTKSPSF